MTNAALSVKWTRPSVSCLQDIGQSQRDQNRPSFFFHLCSPLNPAPPRVSYMELSLWVIWSSPLTPLTTCSLSARPANFTIPACTLLPAHYCQHIAIDTLLLAHSYLCTAFCKCWTQLHSFTALCYLYIAISTLLLTHCYRHTVIMRWWAPSFVLCSTI